MPESDMDSLILMSPTLARDMKRLKRELSKLEKELRKHIKLIDNETET